MSATKKLFNQLSDGVLPGWDRFEKTIVTTTIEAGGTVFMQDVIHPFLYVVKTGLIKLAYFSEGGEEKIKSFIQEGEFFASIASLKPEGRTSFSAIALEQSQLERVEFGTIEQLGSSDLKWARTLQNALMSFAESKERREREFLTLTAEQRYRNALRQSPSICGRVAQKDLAKYLNLTSVGLNRIVKRVRSDTR